MKNNFPCSTAEKINFTYFSISSFNCTNLTNIATNIFLVLETNQLHEN